MEKNTEMVKNIKLIIAFGLGITLLLGAGVYKKSLANEAPTFKGSFLAPNETFTEFVYDINNQGIFKRTVQPGKISVSTGHGSGVVNKTDKEILVNVRIEGLPGEPKLQSNSPAFDKKNNKFVKPIKPGESLSLEVDLEIPRSLLRKNHIVSQGNVIFEDAKDDKILGTLPIKIINSAVRK